MPRQGVNCRSWVTLAAVAALVMAAPLAAQPPGLSLKTLKRTSVSGDAAREAVLVSAEVAAGASTGWHSHPGDEYATVLEGTLEITTRGKPVLRVGAGEAYHNERGAIHETRNVGEGIARVVSTFVVDKGQPLVLPAKASP